MFGMNHVTTWKTDNLCKQLQVRRTTLSLEMKSLKLPLQVILKVHISRYRAAHAAQSKFESALMWQEQQLLQPHKRCSDPGMKRERKVKLAGSGGIKEPLTSPE